jgi:hypothetical protein
VEVNLLDWWVDEVHFEDVFVLDRVWGGVEFPGWSVRNADVKATDEYSPPSLLGLDGQGDFDPFFL